jgi:hypothetical protein
MFGYGGGANPENGGQENGFVPPPPAFAPSAGLSGGWTGSLLS